MLRRAFALLLALTGPAAADDGAAFTRDNLIFALHHEAGHALIDLLDLPFPGSEEDAADALAVILINRVHDGGTGARLIGRAALGFALFGAEGGPPPGRHGTDDERRARLVCLYYGADPARRAGFARDQRLDDPAPCPARMAAITGGWGARLATVPPQDHGPGFRLVVPPDRDALTRAVADELRRLNAEIGLPGRVDVTIEPCGEANAFYDPRARRIVLCTEYADSLSRLWRRAGRP